MNINAFNTETFISIRYAKKHGQVDFSGMTVNDTVLQLLRLGELKEAEKIKNDFKMPKRRYALYKKSFIYNVLLN